jgi:hypothetical protein
VGWCSSGGCRWRGGPARPSSARPWPKRRRWWWSGTCGTSATGRSRNRRRPTSHGRKPPGTAAELARDRASAGIAHGRITSRRNAGPGPAGVSAVADDTAGHGHRAGDRCCHQRASIAAPGQFHRLSRRRGRRADGPARGSGGGHARRGSPPACRRAADRWHLELGGGVSSRTQVDVGGLGGLSCACGRSRCGPRSGCPSDWAEVSCCPWPGSRSTCSTSRRRGWPTRAGGLRAEPAAELGVGYRRAGPRWFWRAHCRWGLFARARVTLPRTARNPPTRRPRPI